MPLRDACVGERKEEFPERFSLSAKVVFGVQRWVVATGTEAEDGCVVVVVDSFVFDAFVGQKEGFCDRSVAEDAQETVTLVCMLIVVLPVTQCPNEDVIVDDLANFQWQSKETDWLLSSGGDKHLSLLRQCQRSLIKDCII